MIFLIFGIIELLGTIVFAVFTFKFPEPIMFGLLIALILNCILWFTLFGMYKDIQRQEENISILQDSLNQCRKKLGLAPLKRENEGEEQEFVGENKAKKNECPACFHKISPNDKECPNCGYKLK
jgi:DNA-directed RNA polymerase subunit RPC12/RpoP